VQQYADALHPSALFADYGGYVLPNPPPVSFAGDVPVVHAMWATDPSASTVSRIKLAASSYPGRPAFVLVALSTWTMGFKEAEQVMQQLGPGFVAVRPDRFIGLIEGAQLLPGTPPPGAGASSRACALAGSVAAPSIIPALPSTDLGTTWGAPLVIVAVGVGGAVASQRWRRRARRGVRR
jgi:hypothetical protein